LIFNVSAVSSAPPEVADEPSLEPDVERLSASDEPRFTAMQAARFWHFYDGYTEYIASLMHHHQPAVRGQPGEPHGKGAGS
jgi:hypothetical protein